MCAHSLTTTAAACWPESVLYTTTPSSFLGRASRQLLQQSTAHLDPSPKTLSSQKREDALLQDPAGLRVQSRAFQELGERWLESSTDRLVLLQREKEGYELGRALVQPFNVEQSERPSIRIEVILLLVST